MKAERLTDKVRHELVEYGLNVVYLALVFAAFANYRRLVLAAHDIVETNYWVAVINALILGKVVMIAGLFRLGRRLEPKPLIYPTLYKAIVFSVFVYAFAVLEHVIKGLFAGEGLTGGFVELAEKGPHELLASGLVVFVALIPFFAFKELARVLGRARVGALFFRQRAGGDGGVPA
jgi:hypothetical protein